VKRATGTLLLAATLALGLGGCGFVFRAMQRNLAAPHTPRLVSNKVKDPRRPEARLSALWVGHATVLIQIDDRFILTDPVFTRTVGELSPRLVEPGIEPANLPRLSATVVSHMHFDHLSFDSLGMIESKTPILLVPPGVRSILPRFSFGSLELQPWQAYASDGLRITAVPVRHVGGRWGIDEAWNRQAFTGYVIEYHGLSVYFGGDSAFDANDFELTRQRFPRLNLALLPICPNQPRGYMRHTHMDPIEALDAFELLGAERMMPIHFDTFINSDDVPGDCPRLLRVKALERHLAARVAVLEIGEQRVFIVR
jgi:L-ascorbate metabolism protein UlaG (beta-lactamase superfamily)